MKFYGKGGIDLKIYEKYFKNKNSGFFIEAGANDGIAQTNTLLFEELGWKGLLVEPNPHKFKECRENRRNCIVENYALVDSSYEEQTVQGYFDHKGVIPSLSLGQVSVKNKHIKKEKQQKQKSKLIEVPAIQLKTLLKKYNIVGNDINFFSLDVEGYEKQVLDGLDLSLNRPEYLFIEIKPKAQKYMFKYLSDFGYRRVEKMNFQDFMYKRK